MPAAGCFTIMARRLTGFVAAGSAAILSTVVFAQEPAPSRPPKPAAAQAERKMSMDDMMKECRQHCQATTKSLEQLTKTIDEARASNDPARMQTALGRAQKELAPFARRGSHAAAAGTVASGVRANPRRRAVSISAPQSRVLGGDYRVPLYSPLNEAGRTLPKVRPD
jgi:hypothetical protein